MGTAYLEDMTVDMLGLGPNRRARGRQWPYAHVLPAWYLEEGGGVFPYIVMCPLQEQQFLTST